MPTYDYRCPANGQMFEVNHRMSEEIRTWGELCEKTGSAPGETPADSPVERMATGGNLMASNNLGSGFDAPSCATGSCCPGGMCGI
jgi:hypothetical protein